MHHSSISVRHAWAVLLLIASLLVFSAEGKAATDNVQELVEDFDEVYAGQYSNTLNILFALGDGMGFVALTRKSDGQPEWLCVGELQEQGDGYIIDDQEMGNQFPFTVASQSASGIQLKIQGGSLTLNKGSQDMLRSFLEDMESGKFAE